MVAVSRASSIPSALLVSSVVVIVLLMIGFQQALFLSSSCSNNQSSGEENALHSVWFQQQQPSGGPFPRKDGCRARGRGSKACERAGVCVIVKHEEAYLDEWLNYHAALGFDHFVILDNTDDFDMKDWERAKQERDLITLIHFPGSAKQQLAYRACSNRLLKKKRFTWAANFDVDEFWVLKKHNHIVDFLKEYAKNGSVAVNRLWFMTAGETFYKPLPVTLRFQYRLNETDDHIKSIFRLEHLARRGGMHPHFPPLVKKHKNKDTNGKEIRGPFNPDGPTDVAVVHHFYTKSQNEYMAKRKRGRSDAVVDDVDLGALHHEARNRLHNGTTFDNVAWEAMKRYVPKYAMFNQWIEDETS